MGVYDGHCGDRAAKFCRDRLLDTIIGQSRVLGTFMLFLFNKNFNLISDLGRPRACFETHHLLLFTLAPPLPPSPALMP